MLDNIEKISSLYVHSYARLYQSKDLNVPNAKYGDLLEIIGDNDGLYMYKFGKWECITSDENKPYEEYLNIWVFNPDTGFFIYSDYWEDKSLIQLEHVAAFNHKPYIDQLLSNISYKIENKHYLVYTFYDNAGLRLYIYGHDSEEETEVGQWEPERFMNALKWKLQNNNLLIGSTYRAEEYDNSKDESDNEFLDKNPTQYWIFIGDTPFTANGKTRIVYM